MNDRPLTLILIAVVILVALYFRRKSIAAASPTWRREFNEAGENIGMSRVPGSELITPEQARREGQVRGIEVELSKPITREQFDRLLGPVSSK